MIKIENLTKYYDELLAVDSLSLSIEKGEIFGFIGPNGAGKSTAIRCIMNMLSYSGIIKVNGKEISPNDNQYKEKIGYLPSEISLYEELSVKEMLDYSASFYKKDCTKKIKELVKFLEVPIEKKIEDLSLGNSKKVGIVIALMHEPDILILDEPTSGLDPLMQEKFYELVMSEKKKGTTIFFSSHILSEVKRVCDRLAIIKDGKIIDTKNINELTSDLSVVTIQSEELDNIKKIKNLNIVNVVNDLISATYEGDINELIKSLSKIQIRKLNIEELSIEEMFLHYYK